MSGTVQMSVQRKILLACLGFVAIVALLGGLAHQQAQRMGQLVLGIYDHAFVGMAYVDQAQEQFLRLAAGPATGATPDAMAGRPDMQNVLDRLDVALERAGSDSTRAKGVEVRAILAALPEAPAAARADQMAQAGQAIDRLVRKYASDGLAARDDAEELATRSGYLLMVEITFAVCLALGVGLLLGRNLSPPLQEIVRAVGFLTHGDLGHHLPPRLVQRGDEIGAVARATATFREVMEQNIAATEERAMLRAKADADNLQTIRGEAEMAAKSAFLATMSHEIRTPMNGVSTIADLLADTELNADQLKMVNIIRQSAKWLVRVINDILNFSKLEANELQIEKVPFLLDEIIDGVYELLVAKTREKDVALKLEGKDLPGICRIGDPLRIRQILLNLLGNAVKFTAQGSVTLAVQADPHTVVFSVIDTGIGIPADKIGSLFQPYHQVRSDIARSYGGTGLGLSITRNLVRLMDGSLDVKSEAGRGSCFTVTLGLPSDVSTLCKTTSRAVASAARWQKPDPAAAAAQAAIILCAEDNAINRAVLARVLDRGGFSYEMAEDGDAALAALDRRRHGLILTDAQMPNLDGWQLAQTIRQLEATYELPRLPIIMVTANALAESKNRAFANGVDDVLTKPLQVDELEAALLSALPVLGRLRAAAAAIPSVAPLPPPDGEIDLGVLIGLVGDEPDDLRALLNDFQTSVAGQFNEILKAAESNDAATLVRQAHSMKGAARYAGATSLARICDALERRAKDNVPFTEIARDIAALKVAITQLPAQIDAALSIHALKPRQAH